MKFGRCVQCVKKTGGVRGHWGSTRRIALCDQNLPTPGGSALRSGRTPDSPRTLLMNRYLEENATPEWKRAYINYRAVKKVIKRISLRLSKDPDPEAHSAAESDKSSSGNEDHGPTRERRRNESSPAVSTPGTAPRPSPGFGTGPSPTSPPIATPAINAKVCTCRS